MARRRLGRWVDLAFVLVLGAGVWWALVLTYRVRVGTPRPVANVPIDKVTPAALVRMEAPGPLRLPDGREVEVVGITDGRRVWDLDGRLRGPVETASFGARLAEIDALPVAGQVTLALSWSLAKGSDREPRIRFGGGLARSYYRVRDFSDVRGFAAYSTKPIDWLRAGSVRLEFDRLNAEPEHLATVSAGTGSENGISWDIESPPTLLGVPRVASFWPSRGLVTVPEGLSGCRLQTQSDSMYPEGPMAMYGGILTEEPVPTGPGEHTVRLNFTYDDAKAGFYWHLYSQPLVLVEIPDIPLVPSG